VFDDARLQTLVLTLPDFSHAIWQPASLPNSIELGTSVDLPPDCEKVRAWFKVTLPPHWANVAASHGRLAIMGNRVMGGPWAVYADGQLVQANLADWRMQWNTPLRVMLPPASPAGTPLTPTEILIAIPFYKVKGYAMGSLFVGSADAVDQAWQARNFWQADAPRAASLVGLLLTLMSAQLALGRRKESVFALFSVNALLWSLINLQYFYDFTGQDLLSEWFGAAMDVSINWAIVFNLLFSFEFEGIKAPRFRSAMVLYACLSTLVTLPLWQWDKNALLLQHYCSLVVYVAGTALFSWHVVRKPTREGIAILIGLVVEFLLAVHTLFFLTNQTQPDHIYTFPFGAAALFMVFVYAINRRTVLALNTSEHYQADLEAQLLEQKHRLAKQHERMRRLEIENQLAAQHDTLMQDLHDGLGSNLTSALLQARGGKLKQDDTLLLLQDLTDELRNLSRTTSPAQRSPNEILAELRQRVQPRLSHGGIRLVWAVDPVLPAIRRTGPAADQHLRALLGEAMANVIKHAQATQVRVSADVQGEAVVIEVTDNGQGFNVGQTEVGRGLPGMRQRAQMLGAVLSISSGSENGCSWRLDLPIFKP
jgi:signal transduction histidine kinase